MSVYLYNLGFSASNAGSGNFSSGGSGVNASNSWFLYVGTSGLPGLSNQLSVISSVAPATNWQSIPEPSTFNAGSDYVILRIFNADNNPAAYLMRTTAIFGQGDSAPSTSVGDLQSPFSMGSYARPVIDCDTASLTPPPGAPQWPGPVTDIGPVSAASSWAYCLGLVHNPTPQTTTYSFNVGASVYEKASGNTYAFGIDPRMKVGGMGMTAATDKDEAA